MMMQESSALLRMPVIVGILTLIASGVFGQKRLVCPHGLLPCTCQVSTSGSLKALEIDCSGKGLSTLPDLRLLRHHPTTKLDLSNNDLQEIPDESFHGLHFAPLHVTLSAEILLSGNPIHTLGEKAFHEMTAYRVAVHMADCGLQEVPHRALAGINGLTALHINDNNITFLEENTFRAFSMLKLLDLGGNPLSRLGANSFSGLEDSLEDLILKEVDLGHFPTAAVRKLSRLHSITLDNNRITALPENIFNEFRTGDRGFILSLKNNRIEAIDKRAFSANGLDLRLFHLLLEGNYLDELSFLYDPCSLLFLPRESLILLDKNPINCDCNFYQLLIRGFYHLKGQCNGPANKTGVSFYVTRGATGNLCVHGEIVDSTIKEECSRYKSPEWDMSCLEIVNESASANGGHTYHELTFLSIGAWLQLAINLINS